MKLTIGLPSFNNFTEIFFTIQALRMYHDLTDCEILVVDNYGDETLENFVKNNGMGVVRYEKYLDKKGPSGTKNKVFELAKGEMVLCMDSHVFLVPGALNEIPVTDDLIQGPLMYNDMKNCCCEWKPVWRGEMWGIWGDYMPRENLPKRPFEIWGIGMGVFLTSKKGWLGFNTKFSGFGAEEGYIHEKYRKAGRKTWCYPSLIWMHFFDRKVVPYRLDVMDRIVNYIIGFKEIGLDIQPIYDHFGKDKFIKALAETEKR